MIGTEPKTEPARRYKISEVCSLLGIERSTLRRHTKQGHIQVNYWKSNNRPFYTGHDVLKFWRFYN